MALVCRFAFYFQLVVLLIGAGNAFDPVVYHESSSSSECQSDDALFDNKQLMDAIVTVHRRLPPPGCLQTTHHSCADIFRCNSSASSGYYQIQAANGSLVQAYCDMEGTNCGGEGGWTRVAYLNVTDTSSQCPTNFSIAPVNTTRFCIRDHEECVPLPSETFGITYSQICGYARGYSFRSPDAFGDAPNNGGRSANQLLSGNYVDGISVTYGSPPNHVWTYAVGYSEDGSDNQIISCPCNSNIMAPVPAYVGNDYYCEAGGNAFTSSEWFTDDPLWDGEMCRGNEGPCCNHTSLPWFMKRLTSHTLASIEVRLCVDQVFDDENIGLERLAVFVK